VDLALTHKQKGSLFFEYEGKKEDVPIDDISRAAALAVQKHEYRGDGIHPEL
jgi:hypothetical protein